MTVLDLATSAWHDRPSSLDDLITLEFADQYGIRAELDAAAIAILVRETDAFPLQAALFALDHDDIVAKAGYAAEYKTFVRSQDDYPY